MFYIDLVKCHFVDTVQSRQNIVLVWLHASAIAMQHTLRVG